MIIPMNFIIITIAHSDMVSANGLRNRKTKYNSWVGWNSCESNGYNIRCWSQYFTVADYAVFYNLTADQVTLTLDSIQDGAAGIGGIQIVGLRAVCPPQIQ